MPEDPEIHNIGNSSGNNSKYRMSTFSNSIKDMPSSTASSRMSISVISPRDKNISFNYMATRNSTISIPPPLLEKKTSKASSVHDFNKDINKDSTPGNLSVRGLRTLISVLNVFI